MVVTCASSGRSSTKSTAAAPAAASPEDAGRGGGGDTGRENLNTQRDEGVYICISIYIYISI